MKSFLELLEDSPFFEVFERPDLEQLAQHARLQAFEPGELIVEEGERAEHFYMLVVGKVRLSFNNPQPQQGGDTADGDQVLIHSISEPGRPVGWSAMVEPHRYRASAVALDPTQMLVLDRSFLEDYCRRQPRFGVAMMKRILWVLGNRLRATRIQLVARRYEREVLAIRALLDQSAELLSVNSPLHKIPYYLQNRLTLSDAFHALEMLRVHGDEQERHLAALCLEILANVRKEMRLYQQLQRIYELVASAPPSEAPREVRRKCSLEFIKLYADADYVVRGEQNLPEQPGQIFIMNHLMNHPENTLPNEFQLTLDTHFVSAVILFQKYGQAPVRVIRKPRAAEYGHQQYYDRLGYLYVYRGDLDEPGERGDTARAEYRNTFLESAKTVLQSGTNLVICPEGSSTTTEQSPLPFRAGAFRLAASIKPEPWIVPIAVANFDKKITRTRLAAAIHPPFRLSEFVPEPFEDEALFDFVNSYRERFRTLVQECVKLASAREVSGAA